MIPLIWRPYSNHLKLVTKMKPGITGNKPVAQIRSDLFFRRVLFFSVFLWILMLPASILSTLVYNLLSNWIKTVSTQ